MLNRWQMLQWASFAMVAVYTIYRVGAIVEFWQPYPLSWSIAYAVMTLGVMGLSTWKIVRHKSVPEKTA